MTDSRPASPGFDLPAHVRALRPKQWIKNLIVFAGPIFAEQFRDPAILLSAGLCFVVFCLASSGVYLFNDVRDAEEDRRHPEKRGRPIASGRVRPSTAWAMSAVLIALALVGSWFLFPGRPLVFACIVVYLLKEALYTAKLKHIVVVDIMVNSIGFPLRAVAGVLAIRFGEYASIEITPWFLMCIFFVSLFIAVCKRRHELLLLEHDAGTHRPVLEDYSPALLDQLVSICTSATIICYALYTILGAPNGDQMLNPMIWTLPFVIFGIFRYLYLVYRRDEGGAPEKTLLSDPWLVVTVAGWLVLSIWVFLGRS